MSHNVNMISIRVNDQLQQDAKVAAKTVGLKVSDLGRIGLLHVISGIKKTGKLTLSTPTPAPRRKKGGAK